MPSYTVSPDATTAGTWYTWVADSNLTVSTSANNQIWYRWSAGVDLLASTSTSTSSDSTSMVWVRWVDGVIVREYSYTPPPETEEQKQARLQREENARQAEDERKRKEAEAAQRAEELLMAQLDQEQQSDWKKNKHFYVRSKSGKRFRIRAQYSQNVDEYDGDKIIKRYCIVPQTRVPIPDQMVMQKLMLEYHEEDFVRIANKV